MKNKNVVEDKRMAKSLMKQVTIRSKLEEKCMKILQKINKRKKEKDFLKNLKLKNNQPCSMKTVK